ncbi:hypothetical protein PtB15_1B925 [Puccinia triticina]|nr:hypothetical protein PtB15_1B925 [Puccinia triticina]
MFTSMKKLKPTGAELAKAGKFRKPHHKAKAHVGKSVEKGSSVKEGKAAKNGRGGEKRSLKERRVNSMHFKGPYKSLGSRPAPIVITRKIAVLRRRLAEGYFERMMEKRSPLDSPLATLLGTATSTAGSLPVVGVPLSGLLSSLPTNALAAPGALTGLLGTLTGALQSAPVLGDLLKTLPISSLLQGNPLNNVKNTLSGLFVAIPILGGPLGGLTNTVTGAASALPISLFDLGSASPTSSQRNVDTAEATNDLSSQSTPLASLLGRSISSRKLTAAREH